MNRQAHHAGCVIIGTFGIMIRGASGSGKSVLAEALMQAASRRGNFAALVSDDRTYLDARGGALIASAPEPLKGLIEIRGIGLCKRSYEAETRVALIVDLAPAAEVERLPDDPLSPVAVEDVGIPRLRVPERETGAGVRMVRWALKGLFPNTPSYI